MDIPAPASRRTTPVGTWHGGIYYPDRAGEPTHGVRQDSGRIVETGSRPFRVPLRTSCDDIVCCLLLNEGGILAHISETLSTADAGVRFLHRRNRSPGNAICPLLHRTRLAIHLASFTANPDSSWVTQQARQFVWHLSSDPTSMRFLIHERDSKFTGSLDQVFVSEGIEIVRPPFDAESQCIGKTLGPLGPSGMPGSAAHPEPASSCLCAQGIRSLLQHCPSTSRTCSANSNSAFTIPAWHHSMSGCSRGDPP